MTRILTLFIICLTFFACSPTEKEVYQSDNLIITKISDHVYSHTTFLDSETYGQVPCNGMIYYNEGEVAIFDTPADNTTSRELINWVENDLEGTIKAIIPTHFHADCLGGLEEFHQHGVTSYAGNKTIQQALANKIAVPEVGFNDKLELKIGGNRILAEYFGEGHTKDNIIGYIPDERVLFGGCLIKELGAGKGNLEDANEDEWAATVLKIKKKYPLIHTVIPGHGQTGGPDLLDYTIKKFKKF